MMRAITSPNDPRLNDIQEKGRRDSTEAEREMAREYAGDFVEIDDDAQVAEIEDSENFWVQAWVYVEKN